MEKQQLLLYEHTGKLPEIFSKDNIKDMINAIDNCKDYLPTVWGSWMRERDKALLMTIYYLALRPNEACSLRFDDFRLKEGIVKIRGETNKQKKDREIPIPMELIPYLKQYFNFNRIRFWRNSPFLFPSLENNHISAQTWKHIFREKILKPIGLYVPPEAPQFSKYRSYTLRHTRATELLNQSNDINLVANFLGHAKLDSTKVYLHKTKSYIEYMRDQLNKIDYNTK